MLLGKLFTEAFDFSQKHYIFLLQMCCGGPARVHALKNMIQHSPSFFNFNKVRVVNLGDTPPNLWLKTADQNQFFFSTFSSLIFLVAFSAEMKHHLLKTFLHTILGTTTFKIFIFPKFPLFKLRAVGAPWYSRRKQFLRNMKE